MANDAAQENSQQQPREEAGSEAQPQDDGLATPERVEQAIPGIEGAMRSMDIASITGELTALDRAIERGDGGKTIKLAERIDQSIPMSIFRAFWDRLVPNFFQKFLYDSPLSPIKPLVDAGCLEMGGMDSAQFDEWVAKRKIAQGTALKIFAPEFEGLARVFAKLSAKESNLRHILIRARHAKATAEAKHDHFKKGKGIGGAANLDA